MIGARLLSILGSIYGLIVSLVYTLVVTRHLSASELATLVAFNAGNSLALGILGYVTVWYPRVLAKQPERYAELAGTGLVVSFFAWCSLVVYMALYGRLDVIILAIGFIIIVLYSWPATAYLSVYKQRTLSILGNISQTIKLAGAFVVRLNPPASAVLLVNIAMTLPTTVARLVKPKIFGSVSLLRELSRGAPYQTLSLSFPLVGAATAYALYLAGGDLLLSYNYMLFQIYKSVYPALAIVPLMYGSLLAEGNKLRRALLDGAVLLYLYLVAVAVMAKSPEWYIAVLRPSELGNVQLARAVWLNGFALLASGIWLHVDTTLRGVEEKVIFTLRDRPAKALMFDVAVAPATIMLTYLLAKTYSALGMVIASAITSILTASYRLKLLGRSYLPLLTRLYLPALSTLVMLYILPIPLLPYMKGGVVETIATYVPNAVILATAVLGLFVALSPPAREALSILLRRLRATPRS
ncbi:MAG: hypothetical protein AT707_00190 [Pyrobaculum sp. JCHS_4]|nr:MAG: hypothetical protein AT707_00190 [Pyrobaculum sp. JCHS_4]